MKHILHVEYDDETQFEDLYSEATTSERFEAACSYLDYLEGQR